MKRTETAIERIRRRRDLARPVHLRAEQVREMADEIDVWRKRGLCEAAVQRILTAAQTGQRARIEEREAKWLDLQ